MYIDMDVLFTRMDQCRHESFALRSTPSRLQSADSPQAVQAAQHSIISAGRYRKPHMISVQYSAITVRAHHQVVGKMGDKPQVTGEVEAMSKGLSGV